MTQRRNGMFKKNTSDQLTKVHPTIADILSRLKDLSDPIDGSNLLDAKRFSGITINNGVAQICLTIDPSQAPSYFALEQTIKERTCAIPGIQNALVVLTAHQALDTPSTEHQALSRGQFHLPNIKNIIAIGSGKGGVGKSTVSVNLAIALQQMGLNVGLLDADIYGPSIPTMLGLKGHPAVDSENKMIPPEAYGLKTMSMGYLMNDETPVIWRGPMIQSALQKFLSAVAWGNLDVLVIDLPPGTGDVQLTLIQKVPLKGAIIVSTPQDVALLDAKKALLMFERVDVPILGMIENMSFFECPSCHTQTPIFHQGSVKDAASTLKAEYLGAIPIDIQIRISSDVGVPFATQTKNKAFYFDTIARRLREKLHLA
jgi:ATP-binding protein involved in chromosome partitioning